MAYTFPENFVWGTATAAHQVEGNNTNSDFWFMEHAPGTVFKEPSGDACDHFYRYPEDIALLAQLGFSAYRFSVEWARVEPEPGFFSKASLDHYRRMLATCLENGIVPCVTYHHFTSPLWFTADGGWEDPENIDRFLKYCEIVTAHLGDLIGVAYTINEANLTTALALGGTFPMEGLKSRMKNFDDITKSCGSTPERFGPFLIGNPFKIRDTMLEAHRRVRDIIKGESGNFPVGVTLAMTDYQAIPGGEAVMEKARSEDVDPFLELAEQDDFIGVQTYSRTRFGPDGPLRPDKDAEILIMGYEYYPEALEHTIRYAWAKAGVPVYVTENGIGTTDDEQRIDYIKNALLGVKSCLEDGIDLLGYFYWSLLDNFEWTLGYEPQFGIVRVDRDTQRRIPKASAEFLGDIARSNQMAFQA